MAVATVHPHPGFTSARTRPYRVIGWAGAPRTVKTPDGAARVAVKVATESGRPALVEQHDATDDAWFVVGGARPGDTAPQEDPA